MGLWDHLQSVAGKLGLIRVVTAEEAEPDRVATRQLELGELASEVEAEQVRKLSEKPAEMSVTFEDVYEAAGVKAPEHGWTIARLIQLLRTEQYESLARESVQPAVLGVLAASNADVKDLVADAVARDKALDAYAEFVGKKVRERTSARRRKATELKEKIRELRKQGEELMEQSRQDEEQWKEWLGKKRAAEDELAWAVGYLLDEPIITRDGE